MVKQNIMVMPKDMVYGKGVVTNYREMGGQVKSYHYKKRGRDRKSFSHAEGGGGHKTF